MKINKKKVTETITTVCLILIFIIIALVNALIAVGLDVLWIRWVAR